MAVNGRCIYFARRSNGKSRLICPSNLGKSRVPKRQFVTVQLQKFLTRSTGSISVWKSGIAMEYLVLGFENQIISVQPKQSRKITDITLHPIAADHGCPQIWCSCATLRTQGPGKSAQAVRWFYPAAEVERL